MKSFNEMKFDPEFVKKIEACANAEELVKLAAENDAELTLADAQKYFAEGSVILKDDDMDKVAGGLGLIAPQKAQPDDKK